MGATIFPTIRYVFALAAISLAALVAAVPPVSDSSESSPREASDPDPARSPSNGAKEPAAPAQSAQTPIAAPAASAVSVPPSPAPGSVVSSPIPQAIAELVPKDHAAVRARTIDRLGKLPLPSDKDLKTSDKTLREVLEARMKSLDAWENSAKTRASAEHPDPSPEDEIAELKAEIERCKAKIAAAAADPMTLLPTQFRNLPPLVPETTRNEIKGAISAVEKEFKETSARLEELRSRSTSNPSEDSAAQRSHRDKLTQKISNLQAKIREREKAAADALNAEAAELAQERLLNAQWETMAETERLKAMEAQGALSARRAEVVDLSVRALEARVGLVSRTLQSLKNLHRTISAREERTLKQAAVIEKSRADLVDDPLERYRAKRAAEILELQAAVIADENALALDPPPTFDEQHTLAIHAATDLENVKHLLDDGRVSHLDALRLNNDFRRIGLERARIEKNELARAAARLANAENALSRVEIEIIYDGRDDRFEIDNLLERLPKADHAKLVAAFEEFERKHTALLIRRQRALEKIARRAEETHEQILKRLRLLDEHFGFIRTHIFWVRDEEPVSSSTFSQANREAILVARAILRMVGELGDRSLWGRFSPEFVIAAIGVVVLPWPLRRLDCQCRLRLGEARPALETAGEPIRSDHEGNDG